MEEDSRPFGYQMLLYSGTGYNLAIRSNGEIVGTQDDCSDAFMEISSAGEVSNVRILGMTNNLYVCFRSDGELYGESDPANEGTIFIENFLGLYTVYQSKEYPDWYIGIKKNGSPKKGGRTKLGQKAVKFLPRRLNEQ